MTQFTVNLEERTLSFSKDIIRLCKSEQPTIITRPLIDQLLRSATSVGANYAEAINAASKIDFRNKIFIAKKEAAETKYWLRLTQEIFTNKNECSRLVEECHYILMTFQKIISTLKNGKTIMENAR